VLERVDGEEGELAEERYEDGQGNLATGPDGYALIKELRSRIGRDGLRTGTVYAALARLECASSSDGSSWTARLKSASAGATRPLRAAMSPRIT